MPRSKWLAGSTGASHKRKKKKKKEIAVQFLWQAISTLTFTLFLSMDPHLCSGTPSHRGIKAARSSSTYFFRKPNKA